MRRSRRWLGVALVLSRARAPSRSTRSRPFPTSPGWRARTADTAFIERYRERQRAAGESDAIAWRPVPYARLADDLKVAVLVSEDIDFFSHHGFAVGEMKLALAEAWEEKELPRGASTLTQQLAKNLWLSPSRNPGAR